MIDFFSGLLTPTIALLAAYIAWQQWQTNHLRLKHELFERRYKLYETITAFIANILARGRVEPNSEMQFLRETKTVVFLFDKGIQRFIEEIYNKAVELYTLGKMENTLTGEKLVHNVDKQREITDWFSEQLNTCTLRFSSFLSFGDRQKMNKNQRRLLLWITMAICFLLAAIAGVLAFGGFYHVAANHGDIFDKVVYTNHLKWIAPAMVVLIAFLLITVIAFVGFWFVLRGKPKSQNNL
jgi:TRAP-type C4-dicarboxylate transport system permease small subunit